MSAKKNKFMTSFLMSDQFPLKQIFLITGTIDQKMLKKLLRLEKICAPSN